MNSEPSSTSPMQEGDNSAKGDPSKHFVASELLETNVSMDLTVRNLQPEDFLQIKELSQIVYPWSPPWECDYLSKQLIHFPVGQLVATIDNKIVGMALSLIILDSDYDIDSTWEDITDNGFLRTHNPAGDTLYGADVMVHPEYRNRGIGKSLYNARDQLCKALDLKRIRASARMPGYHRYCNAMTPFRYAAEVERGNIYDETLSFQIRNGFSVVGTMSDYLGDSDSCSFAAVIYKNVNDWGQGATPALDPTYPLWFHV
jgi:ribosomal protein S18 acetylase RimI-like enzyme